MTEWTVTPAIEWLEDPENQDRYRRGTYIRRLLEVLDDCRPEGYHECFEGGSGCMTGEWYYRGDQELDEEMWLSDGAFVTVESATLIRERRAKDRLMAASVETT